MLFHNAVVYIKDSYVSYAIVYIKESGVCHMQ